MVQRHGLSIADIYQDFWASLLSRQSGDHPYDPSRSSFGFYVRLVVDSVMDGAQAKARVRRRVMIGTDEDNALTAEVVAPEDLNSVEYTELLSPLWESGELVEDTLVRRNLRQQARWRTRQRMEDRA